MKKQKENREGNQALVIELASRAKIEGTNSSDKKKSRKTVITDLVLWQTPKGYFEYVTSPIDNQGKPLIPLEKIVKSKLNYHYQHAHYPLPIVAITDGASNIRKRLNQLSEQSVTVILDWYHFWKKLREFLSMIARNKSEKTNNCKFLFFHLCHGNTSEVFNYLTTQIKTRNQQKLDELITYLTKHEGEIINYELRRQAGKSIGSGRMEKGVDLVIGHRQKHKGMSWSSLGSKALAILKVLEFNGQ